MAKDISNKARSTGAFTFHFTLRGLLLFCVALIAANAVAAVFVIRSLARVSRETAVGKLVSTITAEERRSPAEIPAWGELISQNLELELPDEYVTPVLSADSLPAWVFPDMQPEAVRDLMARCGFSADQLARVLVPDGFTATSSNTVIRPDEALVRSLSPEVRSKFYRELAKRPGNATKTSPFFFPGDTFQNLILDEDLDEDIAALLRSLSYRYGDATYFSDFQVVSPHLKSDEERRDLFRALSRQETVISQLRVQQNTDIDKVLGYWTSVPGVRAVNLRPLLDSARRIPGGNTISVLYLLPPFARERLYTYPLPAEKGLGLMDCHWTTLNFFNETPDSRFHDANYCLNYLSNQYYQVANPNQYGDLVFFLDERGVGVHSAVYIADDIVFTKNGDGYQQPWILMRMKTLVAKYSAIGPLRMMTYRSRSR